MEIKILDKKFSEYNQLNPILRDFLDRYSLKKQKDIVAYCTVTWLTQVHFKSILTKYFHFHRIKN